MTEQEWLDCGQVYWLFAHLRTTCGVNKSKSGRRKLRLFGCAVCRRAMHLSSEIPQFPVLVQAAERVADGLMTTKELKSISRPTISASLSLAAQDLVGAANSVVENDVTNAALDSATFVGQAISAEGWSHIQDKRNTEDSQHAILFRCMFGNPFRKNEINAKGRSPEVLKIAQYIYDNRDFVKLPGLANTLSELGCKDNEVLKHCRHPGPHAKGCWVIDLLLDKT